MEKAKRERIQGLESNMPSRNAIGLDNFRVYNQFIMSNLHELIHFYCDEVWRAARFQGYIGKARSIDRLAKEINDGSLDSLHLICFLAPFMSLSILVLLGCANSSLSTR
jgi:hypothetical protein